MHYNITTTFTLTLDTAKIPNKFFCGSLKCFNFLGNFQDHSRLLKTCQKMSRFCDSFQLQASFNKVISDSCNIHHHFKDS